MREMKFYTYLWLREDGTPYYVGKGKDRRAFKSRRIGDAPPRDRIIIEEFFNEESAFEAEKFLISYYGREDMGLGCLLNLTDGGDGMDNPSADTRNRMRLAHEGKSLSREHVLRVAESNRGKKRSKEFCEFQSRLHSGQIISDSHRKAVSESNKRRVVSEETRKKISLVHLGNKYMTGKELSVVTRTKMSESHRKRFDNARGWKFHKGRNKPYQAIISVVGVSKSLGYFFSANDAHVAYRKAVECAR